MTATDVFTATDVARASRAVLDRGHRTSGALIRDTDGTALLLAPAAKIRRDEYTRAGFRDAAHLLLALLAKSDTEPSPGALGDLAWLTVLPFEDQVHFVAEYVHALDRADGLGEEPVEQLLYDWQQTARAWADDEVRDGLVGDLPAPLSDVEL